LKSTSNEEGEQGVLIATLSFASLIKVIWVNGEDCCKVNGIDFIMILAIGGSG
jgi:hypothetical protein